jgi:hypothetical protein
VIDRFERERKGSNKTNGFLFSDRAHGEAGSVERVTEALGCEWIFVRFGGRSHWHRFWT